MAPKARVASVSFWFRSKERGTRVKESAKNGALKRAGWGWGSKDLPSSPPPPPPPLFLALVSFLARPKPKIPFLRLSLVWKQTETLATQAMAPKTMMFLLARENSLHFAATPPLVPSPSDVWGTRAEISFWWRVISLIWVVLLICRAAREICFSQLEALQSFLVRLKTILCLHGSSRFAPQFCFWRPLTLFLS